MSFLFSHLFYSLERMKERKKTRFCIRELFKMARVFFYVLVFFQRDEVTNNLQTLLLFS